ncbi:MAG: DUF4112 domain-containing protein [Xanthobacteraceae bacterium]|nr:DUF4112 domain-containing protein [Xanthobacteraceae bacterium]
MRRTFEDSSRFDRADGLSHKERLARLDALASFMDSAIVIPGTNIRFGADALIGLVPGIGDAVTAGISCLIVLEARRMGAPGHVIAKMLGNIAIDGLVGAIPVLGDIFDVAFRANIRNTHLLRRHLERTRRV